MPPQIAFVRITKHNVIPVKVFVKRKESHPNEGMSVAINDRSLITLNHSESFQTRVSNSYLNKLLNDKLQDFVKDHLLSTPIEDLYKLKAASFIYEDDKVKCKMVVEVNYLISLRYKLGSISTEERACLGMKSVDDMDNNYRLKTNDLRMINWETEIGFLSEDEDEKKSLSYKFKNTEILGELQNCVKLFLIS